VAVWLNLTSQLHRVNGVLVIARLSQLTAIDEG